MAFLRFGIPRKFFYLSMPGNELEFIQTRNSSFGKAIRPL